MIICSIESATLNYAFKSYVRLSSPYVLWMLQMIWSQSEGGKKCQYVIQDFLFAVVLTNCLL
jgi:hypothetical protein